MLRLFRHLAYDGHRHHPPTILTDRCAPPDTTPTTTAPAADTTPAPTAPTPCGATLRSGTNCQRLVCRFHHGTDPARAQP